VGLHEYLGTAISELWFKEWVVTNQTGNVLCLPAK